MQPLPGGVLMCPPSTPFSGQGLHVDHDADDENQASGLRIPEIHSEAKSK